MTDNWKSKIELAAHIALEAHWGQRDAAGEPYILHPLRVMLAAKAHGMEEDAQIAAVLHDVLEDTSLEPRYIKMHFGEYVLDLVQALTREKQEPYEAYIAGVIRAGVTARRIKMLDLEDNMGRIDALAEIDQERAVRFYHKYRRGIEMLEEAEETQTC